MLVQQPQGSTRLLDSELARLSHQRDFGKRARSRRLARGGLGRLRLRLSVRRSRALEALYIGGGHRLWHEHPIGVSLDLRPLSCGAIRSHVEGKARGPR